MPDCTETMGPTSQPASAAMPAPTENNSVLSSRAFTPSAATVSGWVELARTSMPTRVLWISR